MNERGRFQYATVEPSAEGPKYFDDHEHIVDIDSPEIVAETEKARNLFQEFLADYGEKFDLSNDTLIDETLEAAKERGIFEEANKIRELIFDKNISIYGVSYLSTACNQNCTFCPQGVVNWEIQQKKEEIAFNKSLTDADREKLQAEVDAYERRIKTLSPSEAEADFKALSDLGHMEICMLSGEKIADDPDLVIEYAKLAVKQPNIKELIFNMGSYSENIFKMIYDAVHQPEIKLQHRIFQETYDRDAYAHFTRYAPEGGKKDFDKRYQSQIAALNAGFEEVGIGALFGLTKTPLKEIDGLQKHADYIKEHGGREPKRCALPFGNEPEHEKVEIPYKIKGLKKHKEITELIYALARLAMPTISIVSSERDDPDVLKRLDQYANHTTLYVHPYPGGNVDAKNKLLNRSGVEADLVSQAPVTSRHPKETLEYWMDNGYYIKEFDWTTYFNRLMGSGF